MQEDRRRKHYGPNLDMRHETPAAPGLVGSECSR